MKKICVQSLLRSIAVAVYITAVAIFMNNASRIFGEKDTVFTGIAFLLLLSLSALVVGVLLVGKPIMLYLDGEKKEAVQTLFASAGWMLLFFLIALVVMAFIK